MTPFATAKRVLWCRPCQRPIDAADMAWEPLPPWAANPLLQRRIVHRECAVLAAEAWLETEDPVAEHDVQSCALWLTDSDDCTCSAT